MNKKSGSFLDMQFVTSSISTMLVLLLLGMVVFFVLTANNLSTYVRENISFSVLLSDDMKESSILQFQKKLNAEPYVKQTTYISKEQALEEQKEAMGTDPAEFIGYNPFNASIEIKLNADYANSDSNKVPARPAGRREPYHPPHQFRAAGSGRAAHAHLFCPYQ